MALIKQDLESKECHYFVNIRKSAPIEGLTFSVHPRKTLELCHVASIICNFWKISLSVTIQMNATEWYVLVVQLHLFFFQFLRRWNNFKSCTFYKVFKYSTGGNVGFPFSHTAFASRHFAKFKSVRQEVDKWETKFLTNFFRCYSTQRQLLKYTRHLASQVFRF